MGFFEWKDGKARGGAVVGDPTALHTEAVDERGNWNDKRREDGTIATHRLL